MYFFENQINQIRRFYLEQMITHDEVIEFQNDEQMTKHEDDIFCTEEIRIEEMAIDGICGVY